MHNMPWDCFPVPVQPLTQAGSQSGRSRVAIVGAGLAGCWLARILAEQGIAVTVYEQQPSAASAASGNPAGIAKPFVTRSDSHAMSFHCLAYQFLLNRLRLYNLEEAAHFTPCGVLQLVEKAFPASSNFTNLSVVEADELAGISLGSKALNFSDAGWLNPKTLCCHLIEHPRITVVLDTRITGIVDSTNPEQSEPQPRLDSTLAPGNQLNFEDGRSAETECVVLTTGSATHLIPKSGYLPIYPARGQISRFSLREKAVAPRCVVSGKHYVIPDGQSVLVGATFHRDNINSDVSDTDHLSNLVGLQQLLPTLKVDPKAMAGYAGVRATTPDRLPIVGPLPDFETAARLYGDIRHGRAWEHYPQLPCHKGIYLLCGLGSRGIVTSALCAQLLADHLTQREPGGENPYPSSKSDVEHSLWTDYGTLEHWATLINPARFLIRNLKRHSQPV